MTDLYKFPDEFVFGVASDLIDRGPCACTPTSVGDQDTDITDLIARVEAILGKPVIELERLMVEEGRPDQGQQRVSLIISE